MSSIGDLLRFKEEGATIYPSSYIDSFNEDWSEIKEGFEDVLDLPKRIGYVKFVLEYGHYKIAPGAFFLMVCSVETPCRITLLALDLLFLAKPYWYRFAAPWIPGMQKPIDVTEEKKFIEASLDKEEAWTQALKSEETDIVALKKEVSEFCKELGAHLIALERAHQSMEVESLTTQFTDFKWGFRSTVLKALAEKTGVPGDRGPYIHLQEIGFVQRTLNEICEELGWEKDDGLLLRLKLAEKGFFSRQELFDFFEGASTQEQQIARLLTKLKDPVQQVASASSSWESFKKELLVLDKIVASVFAVTFHVFAMVSLGILDRSSRWWLRGGSILDGIYHSSIGLPVKVSRSDFVEAGFRERLRWVTRAAVPWYPLSCIVVKAWEGPGIRGIPGLFYATYLA